MCQNYIANIDSQFADREAEKILLALSKLIGDQLAQDICRDHQDCEDKTLRWFSEATFQDRVNLDPQSESLPDEAEVASFLWNITQFLEISLECIIIATVNMNRFLAITQMPLRPSNWRPLFVISTMVAQKFWDDKPKSNSYFVLAYPFFSLGEINLLEVKYLQVLDFGLNVNITLYECFKQELLEIGSQHWETVGLVFSKKEDQDQFCCADSPRDNCL